MRQYLRKSKAISKAVVRYAFSPLDVADERVSICESNKCGYYDKDGVGEKVVLKGKPACLICGCNIRLLANSDEGCSLSELKKEPLW